MGEKSFISAWSLLRQLRGDDRLGRGAASMSARSETLRPRTSEADRVVGSVCPYCAVGCAQKVFVKDEKVTQIEGDPASPISRGRLCPKGSASKQLVTSPTRVTTGPLPPPARHRLGGPRPRHRDGHDRGPGREDPQGVLGVGGTTRASYRRTLGIASLGGATLDNEENYLMKKLYTAMGAIQIENQARI